ncbi:MAG: hypothetical protein COB96_06945 [Planctomycetota bacterium]|nr:MAG: hypothetical protein COB96_06945 [Planctomycetota bacterium]
MSTHTPTITLTSASTLKDINEHICGNSPNIPEAIAILDARAARKLAKDPPAPGAAAKATHAADQLREGATQIDTGAAAKAMDPFTKPKVKGSRTVVVTPTLDPVILAGIGSDAPAMQAYLALCGLKS